MNTILIVEDDSNLCELVSIRLREYGFNVVAVPDGLQMFDKLRTLKPALIILDVMLPKIDGYKLCGLLKKYDPYKEIPVIIFTARSGAEAVKMTEEMGGDAYIAKPFDAKVLVNKINELLKSPKTKNNDSG